LLVDAFFFVFDQHTSLKTIKVASAFLFLRRESI